MSRWLAIGAAVLPGQTVASLLLCLIFLLVAYLRGGRNELIVTALAVSLVQNTGVTRALLDGLTRRRREQLARGGQLLPDDQFE